MHASRHGGSGEGGEDDVDTKRGLQNRLGEQNCFLNVVIQSLWHLRAFRHSFQSSAGRHNHVAQGQCIYCAIEVLLNNYAWSEEAVLPPKVLREALSNLFANQGRFQINQTDDASEALDSILTSLHDNLAMRQPAPPSVDGSGTTVSTAPACCEPPCLVHQVFGINVMEQTAECPSCGSSSEPLFSQGWVHYGYTNDLTNLHVAYPQLGLGKLLHLAAGDQAPRSCVNEACTQKSSVSRFLFPSYPAVFTVGLVWDSPRVSSDALAQVFNLLDEQLDLRDVFPNIRENGDSVGSDKDTCYLYHLRGLICFYASHYMAFFYSSAKRVWMAFDDACVAEVGPYLQEHVREKCRLGRLQPLILFYEAAHDTMSRSVGDVEDNADVDDDGDGSLSLRGRKRPAGGLSPQIPDRDRGRVAMTSTARQRTRVAASPAVDGRSSSSRHAGVVTGSSRSGEMDIAASAHRAHRFGLHEEQRLDEDDDDGDKEDQIVQRRSSASSPTMRHRRSVSSSPSLSSSSSNPSSPYSLFYSSSPSIPSSSSSSSTSTRASTMRGSMSRPSRQSPPQAEQQQRRTQHASLRRPVARGESTATTADPGLGGGPLSYKQFAVRPGFLARHSGSVRRQARDS